MPTLPSLARLSPAGILPRDRRANDFIPWESLSREKRAQLRDANISEETWPYVTSSDRVKILRASKVIESEPEAFLPGEISEYLPPYYDRHTWQSVGWVKSAEFDDPSYDLVQAIRLGHERAVGDSFRQDTLLVRVDPSYKTRMDPRFGDEQRLYLKYGERDRTVRVATLYEWARELDIADAFEAFMSPHELEKLDEWDERREERRRRRRIRNMLFTGKFGWRRLRLLWKMRNLAIYWNSLGYRPDRLDMAADLREAMEGMEGAVGSRFKIN